MKPYFYILKSVTISDDSQEVLIKNIMGMVRLWIDTNPPVPTDYYIVLTKENRLENKVKSIHLKEVNQKLDEIFNKSQVKLEDYLLDNKSFRADIHVSQSFIDSYG